MRQPKPPRLCGRCSRRTDHLTRLTTSFAPVIVEELCRRCVGAARQAAAQELARRRRASALWGHREPAEPKTAKPPRPVPVASQLPPKRVVIYRRDGGVCRYCGQPLALEEATLDHVFPRARGGGRDPENLVLSCQACNVRKADRTPDEAGMPLRPVQAVASMESARL